MTGSRSEQPNEDTRLIALELEGRFQRNLAALQAAMPEAFERFCDHQPTHMAIGLVEGEVNLVTPTGAAVYPVGHAGLAAEQVAAFRQNPPFFTCTSRVTDVLAEETVVHSRNSNAAIRALLEVARIRAESLPDTVNFLLNLGVGLGHGLEALMAGTDVRHLCIVEPEPDVFYASLMTFEWAPLLERQMAQGHSLELIVGGGPDQWLLQMVEYVDHIGGFNLVQPYIFQHVQSKATQAAVEVFANQVMPRVTTNLGFFDDERAGLAHTLMNVSSGVPVLTAGGPRLRKNDLPPVFIVANGPSLDEAFDVIRAHRDQAIVISCGTTFGSLVGAGITPDIHLEIERDREISEWLSTSTTPEARSQVRMVGLNVVHPEVLKLFSEPMIALKCNDLGARHLLTLEPDGPIVPQLEDCNPTVANFALTMVEQLGLEEIYLFGLDLGFPRGDLHHSRNSPHYLIRKEEESSVEIFRPDSDGSLMRPGNFGGMVRTLDVFVNAARSAESAIARMADRRIYNTSAGVRLEGTVPLPLSELALDGPSIDTRAVAAELLDARAASDRFSAPTTWQMESMRRDVLHAVDALIADAESPVHSFEEGMDRLLRLHDRLGAVSTGRNGHVVEHLLRGSLAVFSYTLAQSLYRIPDDARALDLHQECDRHFIRFLYDVREQVLSDFITEDRRVRGVQEKLAV